jgi:hypothetical protein
MKDEHFWERAFLHRRARFSECHISGAGTQDFLLDEELSVQARKVKELAHFSTPRLLGGVFCQPPGATRFLAKPSRTGHKSMSPNEICGMRVLPTDREFGETLWLGKTLGGWTPGA